MNEHVKQLALECYNPYSNFDIEKFAELIVRECAKACEDHPGWSGRMIGEQIKQHFGVEL